MRQAYKLTFVHRGAVLSQLPTEAVVTSTIAARHYGVMCRSPYNELEDAGQERIYDASLGKYKVQKVSRLFAPTCRSLPELAQMTWFIEKGEDLQRDQRNVFPLYLRFKENWEGREVAFQDLLMTDEAPRASRYPKEGITKNNCVLTSDLRKLDRSLIQRVDGIDGQKYWDVNFDLVVTLSSAVMKFSLEVKGKEMGN